MASETIIELTDETFDDEVLNAAGAVLVDFHAPWCIDCRMLEPVLGELAEDYAGRVKICTVDVDRSPETGERYRISTIPVLTLFTDGQETEKLVNVKDKATIAAMLDKMLG